jgi:S-adenosyl-L-methionine hydrolase (adenosine-forming)
MKAVLARDAPGVPVIDLFADAPQADPMASAYLLAAYAAWWPAGTVFLCVVDPGVGSDRRALAVQADGRWFVGPDNGLLEIVRRRAADCRGWDIAWRPAVLSASFHGRDLFAPVAAMLARGEPPPGIGSDLAPRVDWPDDLPRIIYIDHYGNAMTGIRAAIIPVAAEIEAGGHRLARARTFSEVAAGAAFWYENSNSLAEIAVNSGRADRLLGLRPGDEVAIIG